MAKWFVGQNVVLARRLGGHETLSPSTGYTAPNIPLGTVGRILALTTVAKAGKTVCFPSGKTVRLKYDLNVQVEWNVAEVPVRVDNLDELEPLKDIGNGLSLEETLEKIKSGELAAHE